MERKLDVSDRKLFERAASIIASGAKVDGKTKSIVKGFMNGAHRVGAREIGLVRKVVEAQKKGAVALDTMSAEERSKIERAVRLMETVPPTDSRLRTFLTGYSRRTSRVGKATMAMVDTYLARARNGHAAEAIVLAPRDGADIGLGLRGKAEMIGPEDAFALLEASERAGFVNRSLTRHRIAAYTADMKAGRWRLTAEPILVGKKGELYNGQHRLYAIIDAGVNVPMTIIRGVDPSAFYSMDQGKARSSADVVGIKVGRNKTVVAAILRLLWIRDTLGIRNVRLGGGSAPGFSNEIAIEMLQRYPKVEEAAKWGRRLQVLCPPSSAGFAYYVCAERDEAAAAEFYGRLQSGESLSRGNPILTLRQRFIADRAHASASIDPTAAIKLLVRTWNAWREGARLGYISAGVVEADIQDPK